LKKILQWHLPGEIMKNQKVPNADRAYIWVLRLSQVFLEVKLHALLMPTKVKLKISCFCT
jgi:hypothetical protein